MVDDAHSRTEDARGLADLIERHSRDAAHSNAIAVCGEWGSGKSWLVNRAREILAERQLSDKAGIFRVFPRESADGLPGVVYNAWMAERLGSLLPGVLGCLAKHAGATSRRAVEERLSTISALLKKLAAAGRLGVLVGGADFGLLSAGLAAGASSLAGLVDEGLDSVGTAGDLQEACLALCRDICEGGGGSQRVLLVVEDLDRCSEMFVVQLLDSLKILLFDDNPHLVVVVPINWSRVNQIYDHALGVAGGTSERYLNKVFAERVNVPTNLNREVFVDRALKEVRNDKAVVASTWEFTETLAGATAEALCWNRATARQLERAASLFNQLARSTKFESLVCELREVVHAVAKAVSKDPHATDPSAEGVRDGFRALGAGFAAAVLHRDAIVSDMKSHMDWVGPPENWATQPSIVDPYLRGHATSLFERHGIWVPRFKAGGKPAGRPDHESMSHVAYMATGWGAHRFIEAGV